jgi:hypothetical protein
MRRIKNKAQSKKSEIFTLHSKRAQGMKSKISPTSLISSRRAQMQMSFAWIFAIIIGIVILSLAIFAVTKISKTAQTQQGAETSKEIGVLLNPLETGFESAKSSSIYIAVDTRIYNSCSDFGTFGNQILQVSQKSFDKWEKPQTEVSFENKYIFSEDIVEGKMFYIFSKPFEFPFKVADLIYLSTAEKEYCFIDAPEDIEEELEKINQENLKIENCSSNSVDVCFEKSNCDVNVKYNSGYLSKGTERFYFSDDALMYAAIFSEKDIYECGLKRLMKRTEQLTEIYTDKAIILAGKNCETNLVADLSVLNSLSRNFDASSGILQLSFESETLRIKNKANYNCRLW